MEDETEEQDAPEQTETDTDNDYNENENNNTQEEETEENKQEELDTSSIETTEEFKGKARLNGSWNKEKIKALVSKLASETEIGKVRVIPLSYFYENFRIDSSNVISYTGYYSRKAILKAGKELGIDLLACENNCKKFTTEGNIQVKFV